MIFRDPWKLRIYIKPGRTDMRKAINGLLGIIRESFPIDPCEEVLFVFCGRSRKLIKLLYWDGNGFCLWQKRLATGSFPWPDDGSQAMQLTTEEIQWLLSGVDFRRKHKIAFFERTG
jgi:transposase